MEVRVCCMDLFINATFHLVYRLDIKLVANDCEDGRLSILSNTTWTSFYLQVQDRLGMKDLLLFYKVQDMLYGSEPEFKRLEGEKDWVEVMAVITQAFQSYTDTELEVQHKVCSDISGLSHGLMNLEGCHGVRGTVQGMFRMSGLRCG